jgi:hypothetical protein
VSNSPTIYDTTGIDSAAAQQMAQNVAADTASGKAFSIVGPNADGIASAAALIGGSTIAAPTAAPAQPGGATGETATPTTTPDIVGTIKNGAFVANPNSPAQKAQILGGPGTAGSTVSGWFAAHLGNYGLVVLGALLGLGAILISNRQTVVKIAKAAAETAE